jgi:hypothetical protein
MIVLYPDVWFETTGVGSGFKLIESVDCCKIASGKYSVVAQPAFSRFEVLRLTQPLSPNQILKSIEGHIALKYPGLVEFIPLFILFRPFPRFSSWLVKLLSHEDGDVGGYCSQIISEILSDIYGGHAGKCANHVSPGGYRARLLSRSDTISIVHVGAYPRANWVQSPQLRRIYSNLLAVTSKLKAYQYPHNREAFTKALGDTFSQMGIKHSPANYGISSIKLRQILTRPHFFRIHELIWPKIYT